MKQIEVTGNQDKCQITAVFGVTIYGNFLPPQLVKLQSIFQRLIFLKLRTWILPLQKTTGWCNEVVMIDYSE